VLKPEICSSLNPIQTHLKSYNKLKNTIKYLIECRFLWGICLKTIPQNRIRTNKEHTKPTTLVNIRRFTDTENSFNVVFSEDEGSESLDWVFCSEEAFSNINRIRRK